MPTDPQKVAVLIPVHQPERSLLTLVRRLAADPSLVVVVADDGSEPEYRPIFDALPGNVLFTCLPYYSGKGNSIKDGLRYILRNVTDVCGVVVLENRAGNTLRNVSALADALRERNGAILLGARTFTKPLPVKSRLGNLLVKLAFSGVCSLKLNDTQTDLRGLPIEQVAPITAVSGERYEYAVNVLLWAARQEIPVMEVPLPDAYEDVGIPRHFHPFRDSYRIFEHIFKFALASFLGFCVDFTAVLLLESYLTPLMDASLALLISVFAGRALSGSLSFTINRKTAFRVNGSVWRGALKYFTILFCLMATSYWLLYLAHLILGLPLWLAKMLVETATFFVNYALQTRLVFERK